MPCPVLLGLSSLPEAQRAPQFLHPSSPLVLGYLILTRMPCQSSYLPSLRPEDRGTFIFSRAEKQRRTHCKIRCFCLVSQPEADRLSVTEKTTALMPALHETHPKIHICCHNNEPKTDAAQSQRMQGFLTSLSGRSGKQNSGQKEGVDGPRAQGGDALRWPSAEGRTRGEQTQEGV